MVMVMGIRRTPARRMAAVRSRALAAAAIALLATAPAWAGNDAGRAPSATQDLRLASIAYRLATRNGDRCQNPDRLTGMLIHDRASYDQRDRALVAARFGLADGFGVRGVVAGGAADRAGLRNGDAIVAINGIAMDSFERGLIGQNASSRRSEAFESALDRALRHGSVGLGVMRNGELLSLRLTADPGCGGTPVVVGGNNFNAWSDGRYVAVTSRLMADVDNDAELAFVVAHEMSHNILRHEEQLKGRSGLLAQFGIGAGRVKVTEIEADTLAVGLLQRAGYDLDAPARFLAHAAHNRPFDVPITHPGLKRRIGIVTAEIARLKVHSPQEPAVALSNTAHAAPAQTAAVSTTRLTASAVTGTED
ncbi:M48 family metalloprotease [Sphingomonas sp. RS6]